MLTINQFSCNFAKQCIRQMLDLYFALLLVSAFILPLSPLPPSPHDRYIFFKLFNVFFFMVKYFWHWYFHSTFFSKTFFFRHAIIFKVWQSVCVCGGGFLASTFTSKITKLVVSVDNFGNISSHSIVSYLKYDTAINFRFEMSSERLGINMEPSITQK